LFSCYDIVCLFAAKVIQLTFFVWLVRSNKKQTCHFRILATKIKALPGALASRPSRSGGQNHSGTGRVLDYDDFANIRLGSEADERGYRGYFHYIPDSGQWLSALWCPAVRR